LTITSNLELVFENCAWAIGTTYVPSITIVVVIDRFTAPIQNGKKMHVKKMGKNAWNGKNGKMAIDFNFEIDNKHYGKCWPLRINSS
jgi:hypothetical protein